MICKICGVNETDNPDGICDDCKASIVHTEGLPPDVDDFMM
jgi:NMD protein affecting ribosome stability and mRNA decay